MISWWFWVTRNKHEVLLCLVKSFCGKRPLLQSLWGVNHCCLSPWRSPFCRKPPSVDSSPWRPRRSPRFRLLSTLLPWPQTWDPSLIIARILSSMGKSTFWGHLFLLSLLWGLEYNGSLSILRKVGELGGWGEDRGKMWRDVAEKRTADKKSPIFFFFNLKFKNWCYGME